MKTQLCLMPSATLEKLFREQLGVSGQQIKKHFQGKRELLKKEFARGNTFELDLDLVNHGLINPCYVGPTLDVLYQDEHFLAVHKPEGIHGHPLTYKESDTILNWARAQGHFDICQVAPETQERGLLYRLDRETSGILVMARTQDVYEEIRHHFSTGAKLKEYVAVVKGLPVEGAKTFEFSPASHKGERQSEALPGEGMIGELDLKIDVQKGPYALVTIVLKQGLRHQIRKTMESLGHPIVGDDLYGGERYERMLLHARRYIFRLREREYEFVAPLGASFDRFLDLHGLS